MIKQNIVYFSSSNEELVSSVDVVFIGLLPGPARDILPHLPFRKDQILISMMAAVDFGELVRLTYKVDARNIARTVPLPSNSQRTGTVYVIPFNLSQMSRVMLLK